MKVKVIKNDREHKAALKAIDALWHAKSGTPMGDTLELLLTVVEAYEEKKHAILPPEASHTC